MKSIFPSHTALLVTSVKKSADYLRPFGFQIGEESNWEGEGTKEIYVEVDQANSLLLMEPTQPGAYRRAMDKRGPGLHHLAIDVLNLESYIHSLSGTGWLLHPKSLHTIKEVKTAYLARPGFPGLIEVQERQEILDRPLFVNRVTLNFDKTLLSLLKPIGLDSIVGVSKSPEIVLAGKVIAIADLLNG